LDENESDSHYRMKYLHQQSTRVTKPKEHDIPPRIQTQVETACAWYYQLYYPRKGSSSAAPAQPGAQGWKLQ
jgi:hypothetical protein